MDFGMNGLTTPDVLVLVVVIAVVAFLVVRRAQARWPF